MSTAEHADGGHELQPSLDVLVLPSSTHIAHQHGATVRLLWFVPNVRKLNRKNKITSKPFTVADSGANPPSEPPVSWTFRLILLRGIEKAPTEADDSVGVFVEYVPSVGGLGAPAAVHPETCKVRCRVPPLSVLRSHKDGASTADGADGSVPTPTSVMGEMLHRFHPSEGTAAFRSLVPPAILNSPSHVDGDGNMLLELKLHFGMASAVADVVAVTTEKIGSTFWKGMSAIGSTFSHLKQQVTESLHATETKNSREEAPGSVPWESVPPKWRGREDKWVELCTVSLPTNDLTFLSGPERGLTPDEQVLMAQMGLSHKAVMTANADFDFDRDVHAGLLQLDALRVQRFNLVPAAVPEIAFWRNYLWKVAALGLCSNAEQVQLALSILNAPARAVGRVSPSTPSSTTQAAVTTATPPPPVGETVANAIREAAETTTFVRDLLTDGEGANPTMLETGIKSCGHQRKTLADLRRQIDGSSADGPRYAQQLEAAIADIDSVLAQRTAVSTTKGSALPAAVKPSIPEPAISSPPQTAESAKTAAVGPVEALQPPTQLTTAPAAGSDPSGSAHSSFVDLSPSRQRSSSDDRVGDLADAAVVRASSPPQAEQPVAENPATENPTQRAEGARVESKAEGAVGGGVARKDSFDELGFDDLPPSGVGAAGTPNPRPATEAAPAGGSTAKRSSSNLSSEFTKMPWEEEE